MIAILNTISEGITLLNNNSENKLIYELVNTTGDQYLNLPRHEMPHDDLVEIKFAFQKWRFDVAKYIIDQLKNDGFKKVELQLEILMALHLKLSVEDIETIKSVVKNDENLDQLFISQNCSSLSESKPVQDMVGPTEVLPIKPIKPSKWNFERWSKLDAFSKYRFTDDGGIIFRGVTLYSGDVFVTSINMKSAGIYTSIPRPASYSSHFAYFAILDRGGKKFPSIMEVYEHGVRAIPLNMFLDKSFTSYTEVYRLNEMESFRSDVSDISKFLMKTIYGYNFNTVDNDPNYIGCTEIYNVLLSKLKIDKISMKSYYRNETIVENYGFLDFHHGEVLNPMDFAVDDRTDLIGIFDNGEFKSEIARFSVVLNFVQLISSRKFTKETMPLRYKINYWGIDQVKKDNLLGGIIRKVEGFGKLHFPKGPIGIMALIEPAQKLVAQVVESIKDSVSEMLEEENYVVFSIDNFLKREDLEREIVKHNSKVSGLFQRPAQVEATKKLRSARNSVSIL